jgi:PST family polysaccharide transporter
VNVALGVTIAAAMAILAPAFVAFYREPRLFSITVALGLTFIFNGASTQHRAILQRHMRLTLLALVDTAALFLSIVIAVTMAVSGAGYWSLVALTLMQPVLTMPGVWIASRWIPGRPRRGSGIRSMIQYGGTVTLNNVVMYLAYNVDKVLLGRVFGAEALGVYGRAYQLINIPAENLNSAMGAVAFPALSRLQDNPTRLKSYFLTGYTLLLSIALPVTVACGLFSHDIIRVFLGPKWDESAVVFRLLAPTVVSLSLINPFGWLMYASGYARRSLMIAIAMAPVVLLGYLAGVTRGPQGVAFGYSAAMLILVVPVIAWARRGTPITGGDIFRSVWRLTCATAAAAVGVYVLRGWLASVPQAFARLTLESAVFFAIYGLVLLFVLKQGSLYVRVFREAGMWPFGKPRLAAG